MGITNLDALNIAGVPTMGMSGIPATTGNVFFVNSVTGSNGNIGSADSPLATIAGAYLQCLADHGDIIVCAAGHAETVSAAGGIALSKSGVTIWGLGSGADRPTLTFSTSTAATVLITGANTVINNIVGVCNIDQLVSPFVVNAADCTLNIEWHDGAANKEALRAILGNASADRLNVNLTYIGFTAGTHVVNAIRLVGTDTGNITVDFFGILTTAVVEFVTTASTNIQVSGYFYVSGTTNFSKDVVDTVTGSTWAVSGYDGAAGLSFDGGSGKAVASGDVSSVAAVQATVAKSATAVMVNGNTIFTVAGGPIEIEALYSVCVTADDATASTVQYSATPTIGSAQTISGASGSIANAAAGASISLIGTALATAALYNANGPNLGMSSPGGIIVPAGTIKLVIGVGSTTGTWQHFIRYRPLATGITVS